MQRLISYQIIFYFPSENWFNKKPTRKYQYSTRNRLELETLSQPELYGPAYQKWAQTRHAESDRGRVKSNYPVRLKTSLSSHVNIYFKIWQCKNYIYRQRFVLKGTIFFKESPHTPKSLNIKCGLIPLINFGYRCL